MKTVILFAWCLAMSFLSHAQTPAKKPATAAKKTVAKTGKPKKSTKTNKLKTNGDTEFEEVICYDDGPCTFNILKGDTLVYEVNSAGKQYTLLVVPNKFDAATMADFSWVASAPENRSGHVVISTDGIANSKKYLTNLNTGEQKLSDASTFWLTNANFKEMSKGQTTLAIDNGNAETYTSPEADAVAQPVNYKGKSISLEGFAMQTKPEGQPGRKELWVLNISNNLLILKMDNGDSSLQLKEVREKKYKK